MTINVPTDRFDPSLQKFTACDPLITKPSSGTYACCPIFVPYAHMLRRATIGMLDSDIGGSSFKIELMQADEGDAKAGTQVGSDVTLVDSSATVDKHEVTLANSDKAATAAGRFYWLLLTGDNAGVLVHMPALTLEVEPVTYSQL
jgi:hypothetical protein